MAVTLRTVRRETGWIRRIHSGDEIEVTLRGKPFCRILPVRPRSFIGAGKHLSTGRPLTPDPVPAAEWKGVQ